MKPLFCVLDDWRFIGCFVFLAKDEGWICYVGLSFDTAFDNGSTKGGRVVFFFEYM